MPDATPIVFVVDQDAAVRDSIQVLVRSAGWRVEGCRSALEFLSRPRSGAPSCVVLDVQLPDRPRAAGADRGGAY